jgi:hypothetical protein
MKKGEQKKLIESDDENFNLNNEHSLNNSDKVKKINKVHNYYTYYVSIILCFSLLHSRIILI